MLPVVKILGDRLSRSVLAAVAMLTLPLGPAMAELSSAQLHSVFPPGAKQGSKVEVVITGAHLDGVSRLRFSHPGITAVQNSALSEFSQTRKAAPNQFMLTIAPDVPVGVYDVYAIGLFGISNPRRFVVSDKTEIIDTKVATAFEAAKEITVGSMISARVRKNSAVYYKFTAKAGQRLLVDCCAYRIDSRMDATLVLLGASGNEIAKSRDVNRRDPLLDFTAKADGQYVIKVYDYLYGGGDDYFFRLSVHDRPHIDFIFPPAGLPGSKGKYFLFGRNLPGSTVAKDVLVDGRALEKLAVEIRVPEDAASRSSLAISGLVEPVESGLDQFEYGLETAGGNSNPYPLGFATEAVVLEQEPANNDRNHPQKVTLPCEIAGQFYPRGDEDWYAFDGKKGDVYWIEAISHQLGQPADPYVLLQRVSTDDKGVEKVTLLQELDDNQLKRLGNRETVYQTMTDDPIYRFQVPQDGSYRILIRDLYNRSRGNPRFVYRLSIRREQPDFRLVAVAESPRINGGRVFLWNTLLRKDGAVPIRVVAFRRDGFKGPIELSVEGLPAGVTAPDVIIGSGQTSAYLLLSGGDSVTDWAGVISIVGKASIGEVEVVRKVRSGGVVWGWIDDKIRGTFRSRMFREIALGVTTCESDPVVVRIGEGKPWQMVRGGKLEIPVSIKCDGKMNGDLRLQPINASANLRVRGGTIKRGEGDGKIEINIGANAKPGTYSFSMKGEASFKYRRYPQAIAIANREKEEITKIAAELAEASRRAMAARQAAEQMAADANMRLKQASGATSAESKRMADALKKAETVAKKAAAIAGRAEAAKKLAEDKALNLAKLSKAVYMRWMVFSKPVTIKVIEPPISVAEIKELDPLKQSEKIEIPITINRLNNYNEQVELSIELPARLKGVKVAKLTIPAGQRQGTLTFEAAADATPGNHRITLDTRFVYNQQSMQTTSSFTLKVVAAADPSLK
jgi:hypothetical protein